MKKKAQTENRWRPSHIEKPGPDQESVWDYPRPPRVEPVAATIRIESGGIRIAESNRVLRVIETASPPVYYLPPEDVRTDLLSASSHRTFCEWKGEARYWDIHLEDRVVRDVGWSYPEPTRRFEAIRDYLAFYAARMDACYVGEERVAPQAGDFYGGWITSRIKGPFKGGAGSGFW